MRTTIKIVMVLFLLFGIKTQQIFAQQTAPAKAKTTQTKKTPAKKTAKKTKKAGMVFICDGVHGYTYHSRRSCAELAKCKGRILDVTKQDAINSFGKEACKNCN